MSETTNLKLFKHDNPSTNENQFNVESALNENWDKIDEAYGKLNTNKADKTDVQEIEQDISNIKSNQTTQNDLLQRTQSALINITTEKSSNINVKDSSDLNARVNVFGISEQETREGYNLFNNTKTISNVTYNSEEDKWVFNLPGKYDHIASKGTFFKNIKANTNYTIYLNILKNTANNIITFNTSNTIWNAGFNIQAGKTGVVVNNIKTKEDLSSALYDLWFSHTNTITGEFEVQIMLLEGTFTSENIPDYEQYGASPSSEFPSEIKNVEGNVDITICNKNLFDKTKITDNNYLNENGGLTSNNLYCVSDFIDVLENETYFLPTRGTTRTKFYNKNKQALTNTWDIVDGDKSFIVPIKAKYIRFSINKETVNIDTFQFERNDAKTDYIQNEQQTITFPLSEGQKLYDKDYPASDGIHHVRKQVELDGTEAVMDSGSNATTHHFTITFDDKKIGQHGALSNMFVNSTVATLVYSLVENSSFARITFKMPLKYTTVDSFKTFLAQQKENGTPVIVEYELAKEEIEPYTPEQQEAYNKLQNAQSYYNVTNVFTDNALLEFKYIADSQTWVVNLVKNEVANTNKQLLEIAGGN